MKRLFVLGLIITLSGCATVNDSYRDRFVESDLRYENTDVGFSLTFNDSWKVYPHTASMPASLKAVARDLKDQGAELLYFATSKDGLVGARAIVEETEWPLEKFFKVVYEVNREEIHHIDYNIISLNGTRMVEWLYSTDQFTFHEFQARKDGYNIRMSFWVFTSLYNDYRDEFRDIASTFRTFEGLRMKPGPDVAQEKPSLVSR